jgi:hypothetical protein
VFSSRPDSQSEIGENLLKTLKTRLNVTPLPQPGAHLRQLPRLARL